MKSNDTSNKLNSRIISFALSQQTEAQSFVIFSSIRESVAFVAFFLKTVKGILFQFENIQHCA